MNFNIKKYKNEDVIINIIIIVIFIIALFPLTKIWITTADDMDNFLYA